jgi:hypothetical protein
MKVGAVIITMGNRPDELRALVESIAKQEGDPVQVVGDGFLVALHLGLQLFYPVFILHRGFVDIGESSWPAVAWLAVVGMPRNSP